MVLAYPIFPMVSLSDFSRSTSGFRPALPINGFTWHFTWQAYKRLLFAARRYFVISGLHEYWAGSLFSSRRAYFLLNPVGFQVNSGSLSFPSSLR